MLQTQRNGSALNVPSESAKGRSEVSRLLILTILFGLKVPCVDSVQVSLQLPEGRPTAQLSHASGSRRLKADASALVSWAQQNHYRSQDSEAAISTFAFLACQHLKPSRMRMLPKTAGGGRKG